MFAMKMKTLEDSRITVEQILQPDQARLATRPTSSLRSQYHEDEIPQTHLLMPYRPEVSYIEGVIAVIEDEDEDLEVEIKPVDDKNLSTVMAQPLLPQVANDVSSISDTSSSC